MIRAADAIAAMQSLPVRPLEPLLAAGPALILAPHPDDESLGCGGLIAAACAAGIPPYVLVLTDGAGSHPRSRAVPPSRMRAVRRAEAQAAVAQLALPPGRIGFLNLPDTASPTSGPAFDAAVTAVATLAIRIGAGSLLATWAHDPHCDHESAHLIARAAAAQAAIRHLAYPVWGWTLPPETPLAAPLPTGFRLDIGRHLPAKRRAIAAHRSQHKGLVTDDPHGFTLAADLLAVFDRPFETYIDP